MNTTRFESKNPRFVQYHWSDPDLRQRVLDLHALGNSIAGIARKLETGNRNAVSRVLQESGRISKNPVRPDGRKNAGKSLYLHRRGLTVREISARTGFAETTVRRHLRILGVSSGNRRTKIPVRKHSEILQAFLDGKSRVALAKEHSVSTTWIGNILHQEAAKHPDIEIPRIPWRKVPRSVWPEILEMRSQGMTLNEIGKAHGISLARVKQILQVMKAIKEEKTAKTQNSCRPRPRLPRVHGVAARILGLLRGNPA